MLEEYRGTQEELEGELRGTNKNKVPWTLNRVIDLAKTHKQQLTLTIAYCFSFVGLGVSLTGFGPTLLELVDLTDSSEKLMGYIFTVKGFGYFLGSMSGRLFDRFDGHKILFVDVLVSGLLFLIVPFVPNLWGQAILWFTIGIFSGGVDTGVNTLIVWVWQDKVNPFMQLIHFSFGLGAFLSPLILAGLQDEDLKYQYFAIGLPFAVSAFPLLFLTSPKNTQILEVEMGNLDKQNLIPSNGKLDESTEKFSITGSSDELPSPEHDNRFSIAGSPEQNFSLSGSDSNIQVEEAREADGQVADKGAIVAPDNFARRVRIEVVIFAATLLLLDVGAEIGYGGWVFTYARNLLELSKPEAAYVNAVFWGTFMVGRLAAVGIALVLTPKTMLFSDIFGCSVGLSILIAFPYSPTALWVCSVIFGFSIASVFPTVISLPQNLGVPITGTDTSWMVVGASCGEMVVPLLIGYLQEQYSMVVLVVVVLIVEILGAITFAILLFRVKFLKEGVNSLLVCFNKHITSKSSSSFTKLEQDDGTIQ